MTGIVGLRQKPGGLADFRAHGVSCKESELPGWGGQTEFLVPVRPACGWHRTALGTCASSSQAGQRLRPAAQRRCRWGAGGGQASSVGRKASSEGVGWKNLGPGRPGGLCGAGSRVPEPGPQLCPSGPRAASRGGPGPPPLCRGTRPRRVPPASPPALLRRCGLRPVRAGLRHVRPSSPSPPGCGPWFVSAFTLLPFTVHVTLLPGTAWALARARRPLELSEGPAHSQGGVTGPSLLSSLRRPHPGHVGIAVSPQCTEAAMTMESRERESSHPGVAGCVSSVGRILRRKMSF